METRNCNNRKCRGSRLLSKFVEGGHYMSGLWYCGDRCLTSQIVNDLEGMVSSERDHRARFPRPKMALFLLQMGLITREQMDRAVREQRKWKHGRIGEWLREMGFVNERDITIALSKQFGLPWVDVTHAHVSESAIRVLPAQIATAALIFPLECDGRRRTLSIVFGGTVDFPVIKVLKKMLDCTITSYVGDESHVLRLVSKHYGNPLEEQKGHDNHGALLIKNAYALANFILSEAKRCRSENIMIDLYMHLLWVRFLTEGRHEDIFVDLSSEESVGQSHA